MAATAAWSISVRRMRRNATGTAVRPTSPQTQNAPWNPPVSGVCDGVALAEQDTEARGRYG